jgi:nucleoside-diphosphate-sugar epimerase
MKVLVTGGSGVVGRSAVTALLARGHTVRLLSRGATDDVRGWPGGVEAWPGDVGSAPSIEGSADGCGAVLHLVGVVDEEPPERTFERINVQGTEHLVREAERAGCPRFVFVSSLGVDVGESPYHKSKAKAEQVARTFNGEWVIVRPGAVYGPGDEHLSIMLRMVRTLPMMPSLGDGNQRIQPIWHEDLAAGLAVAVDKPGLAGRVLEVGGLEVISQHDLVEKMQELTGRKVPHLPIPDFLASLALRGIEAVGLSSPISQSQLDMLREENMIAAGKTNALIDELGVRPTPLDEGLKRFMKEQAEQLPDRGLGTLQRKIFAVAISPSTHDADWVFAYLREHLLDLMPSLVGSDPEGDNPAIISKGETLTLSLPMRGHVQVRVMEAAQHRITLMTLEGHPLAGAVRFIASDLPNGVRFEIHVYDRPANALDWMLMRPIGDRMQESTWQELADTVARVVGASDPKVVHEVRDLDEAEAAAVQRWARELAMDQRRANAVDDIERATNRQSF